MNVKGPLEKNMGDKWDLVINEFVNECMIDGEGKPGMTGYAMSLTYSMLQLRDLSQ